LQIGGCCGVRVDYSIYILGGWNAEGKSPSVWDTFAHTEGKIRDQSTGDVACDSYNMIKEDVKMIKV